MTDDMYATLLKTPEKLRFGQDPTQIVLNLSKSPKGAVPVSVTKLLVNWNGNEYEPIECSQVGVEFIGENTVVLKIVATSDDDSPMKSEAPPVDAVIPSEESAAYALQGDDFIAFETLSEFRRDNNKGEKTADNVTITRSLESDIYDIQDLPSVQNAMVHLAEQEKQYIDKGCKVVQVDCPKFEYTGTYTFKLTEQAVLLETPIVSNDTEHVA